MPRSELLMFNEFGRWVKMAAGPPVARKGHAGSGMKENANSIFGSTEDGVRVEHTSIFLRPASITAKHVRLASSTRRGKPIATANLWPSVPAELVHLRTRAMIVSATPASTSRGGLRFRRGRGWNWHGASFTSCGAPFRRASGVHCTGTLYTVPVGVGVEPCASRRDRAALAPGSLRKGDSRRAASRAWYSCGCASVLKLLVMCVRSAQSPS